MSLIALPKPLQFALSYMAANFLRAGGGLFLASLVALGWWQVTGTFPEDGWAFAGIATLHIMALLLRPEPRKQYDHPFDEICFFTIYGAGGAIRCYYDIQEPGPVLMADLGMSWPILTAFCVHLVVGSLFWARVGSRYEPDR